MLHMILLVIQSLLEYGLEQIITHLCGPSRTPKWNTWGIKFNHVHYTLNREDGLSYYLLEIANNQPRSTSNNDAIFVLIVVAVVAGGYGIP